MTFAVPKKQRAAFTLIEVIVSVMIISFVVLSLMEISSRSKENAVYLSQRNKASFADSFYLLEEISKYHKKEKNAYELLQSHFHITNDESREILKQISREIIVPEPINIPSPGDTTVKAEASKVILKEQYSSSYFQFKLNAF
ncbi:prepilin-type N-terminal cleavage/methylation domain-containing protein [Sulfurovum sp.]|jgi:prepilin-type N-terminal cleavage/methylation domain-containing protein|uniref:type IV pilus modification PilV family protein n=1 Tax=Sulfurovum sp. TaxID=1969726 RepID=UPI002A365D69|nr:prepilin-type N-terminal cleavage/methylation domain-containing protein [Sulfurovum sp.]MDD2451650.1 prepilin-type N-terminal cleavage/methylation domain-containing protein [Sulfurovum sp.]MDD3500187.1 prepilin-type N-terminal cleavage/methylation domain-containing protein [Sulfurovum sp.]MDY0402868.1 prepilin-type N-terminal cleavage/methylation domain-containing protein [Sulfurovum sp.]